MRKKIDKNTILPSLKSIWTIPNILTMFRILLIIPICIFLSYRAPMSYFIAFLLILTGYITDLFDGWIARRTNSITRLGTILDPLGDKLLSVIVSAVLMFQRILPLWFFILIIARDILIIIGGIYVYYKWKDIAKPNILGKLNTFFLGLLIPLYVLQHSITIGWFNKWWETMIGVIVKYGTYAAGIMILLSGTVYGYRFLKTYSLRKEN